MAKVLKIPNSLNDISSDWVVDLLYQVLKVPKPEAIDGTHSGLSLLRIKAEVSQPGFREVCHVTAKCTSLPKKVFQLLIQIVPKEPELKELILKHNLFAKEIIFFEEVLPLLAKFVKTRSKKKSVQVNFSVPKFIYGDFDHNSGNGVIILEDYTEQGFQLQDTQLMLLKSDQVGEVIKNLATFHAICVAFETTEEVSLEELFPVLDSEKGCTWFQKDMYQYLEEMYLTCKNFLKVIRKNIILNTWYINGFQIWLTQ